MSWVAVGVGTVAFASSMMGAADEQDRMKQDAEAYGIRSAGISFGADRRQAVMTSHVAEIKGQAKLLEMSVDKAQAQKEAMIRVNAALTGVGGDSVNDTISQTETDTAEAKYRIGQQEQGAINQKQVEFVDVALNADIAKGNQDTSSKSGTDALVTGGLSFVQGFFGAGGSIGGGGGSSGDWDVYGGGAEWDF